MAKKSFNRCANFVLYGLLLNLSSVISETAYNVSCKYHLTQDNVNNIESVFPIHQRSRK